jgi:hypothetical protein
VVRILSIVAAAVLMLGAQAAFAKNSLDIKEVVRVDSDPYACGIVDAVMTYKNSSGDVKEYHYKVWGSGCSGD